MPRLVLHVGTPKSGTSFIQSIVFRNQDQLHAHGVLVPGVSRSDHGSIARGVRRGDDTGAEDDWARWCAVVDEARAWPGTVLVSNEWFSLTTGERWSAALDVLDGLDLTVVVTARDAVRQATSAWQETLKLGRAVPLDRFVRRLENGIGRWSWEVLDAAELLDRWAGSLDPGRVSVVTVPHQAPRGELWTRFSRACGISPDVADTSGSFGRESVDVVAARLLEMAGPRFVEAVRDDPLPKPRYRWIQRYVAHDLLTARSGDRIRLRDSDEQRLRERSATSAARLVDAGYRIVGDPDDLRASTAAVRARHPSEVTTDELLEAAMDLAAGLLGKAVSASGDPPGTSR